MWLSSYAPWSRDFVRQPLRHDQLFQTAVELWLGVSRNSALIFQKTALIVFTQSAVVACFSPDHRWLSPG